MSVCAFARSSPFSPTGFSLTPQGTQPRLAGAAGPRLGRDDYGHEDDFGEEDKEEEMDEDADMAEAGQRNYLRAIMTSTQSLASTFALLHIDSNRRQTGGHSCRGIP